MLEHSQPRSLRACSRDDPECGARRGVAACNRSPREARDPARQALRPGCEELAVNRSGANAGERSAAPEPKTATVERREASVPRHGKLSFHGAPHKSTALRTTPDVSARKALWRFISLYATPRHCCGH